MIFDIENDNWMVPDRNTLLGSAKLSFLSRIWLWIFILSIKPVVIEYSSFIIRTYRTLLYSLPTIFLSYFWSSSGPGPYPVKTSSLTLKCIRTCILLFSIVYVKTDVISIASAKYLLEPLHNVRTEGNLIKP